MEKRAIAFFFMSLSFCLIACSPRIVERVVTEVEYRDRIVHDTARVEIPYEVEKIVTRDTVSHLENSFAKSDAVVSGGFLSHSLESKPQYIQVPVEVHVTDTLYKKTEIIEREVEVEKPLSKWKSLKLEAFWWLVGCLAVAIVWAFRKPIIKLLKLWLPL